MGRREHETCWHCGSRADNKTLIEHRGRRKRVPLCDKCRSRPKRWLGWRPVLAGDLSDYRITEL